MGFTGNLSNQVKWMKSLEKKIPEANQKAFIGKKAQEDWDSLAKKTLEAVVYTPYPPGSVYERTGDLIRSVFVSVGNGDVMSLGIGLDSNISTEVGSRKGTKDKSPEFSYGKYFLPEYSKDSFLVKTRPNTETRPFLVAWELALTRNILRQIEIELQEALKS